MDEHLAYLRPAISNGIPREQALIRRWWYQTHGARGRLVWEYYLEGPYTDGIWFPDDNCTGVEETGQRSRERFPIRGREVVLCEAKIRLTPEVIGQALVYSWCARRTGAIVRETVVFAEAGTELMREAANALGLSVVVLPSEA